METGSRINVLTDPRAAGAVHDFNNLLSVIMVCADEIASMPGEGEHRERAAEIYAAASRGAELIRGLLGTEAEQARNADGTDHTGAQGSIAADLESREASHEPHLRRGNEEASGNAIDIAAAIGVALPLLERGLGAGVQLGTSFEGDLPPVLLRADALERVLLNLAANSRAAFEATDASSPTVVIQSSQVAVRDSDPLLEAGWYVRLAFSDNGGGMDFEVAARALEPGFSTKREGGTGLGLSIVCQIVREAGGDVRLNTTPGVGTTITLYVPIAPERGEATAAPATPGARERTI